MRIVDCKLLSIEEANKIDKELLIIEDEWWLRSPGCSESFAMFVASNGICEDGQGVFFNMLGIRPALYLESYEGKSFKLANHNWINIFDNVYLCEDLIGYICFNFSDNNYDGSIIQKHILSWCRSRGLEFNSEIELESD